MIRYHAIESGAPWNKADEADLISFDWQSLTATFEFAGDNRSFLVFFEGGDAIVRMLDEMALSTETPPEHWINIIPHHFAYRVEGDPFFEAQSEAWRFAMGTPQHYRFITGSGCLDVISSHEPEFILVDKQRPQSGRKPT